MKRVLRYLSFMTLMMSLPLLAWSQQRTVTGTVTSADGGEPLIGVTVMSLSTESGTVTDFDGQYSIQVEPDDVLRFSYIGYQTLEIRVADQSEINVMMSTASELLEEVVVVGYGTQKTKDLTSSITTVGAEQISKTPTAQPMEALQGQVAGVQIVNNGAPGEAPTVRVRGIGSFPGVGNSTPLYVVDGMFFDNITFLNNSDIESISVLKDASAAAIYGVRAANGVVIIETKSGQFDQKPEITYDGYYGIQRAQNVLKVANAEQFTQMALESGSAADISYIDNAMQRYGRSRINPNVPDVNTSWYDEILRNGAITNHSLNINGGGSNSAYSVSGSYLFNEGILDMKNEFERFNLNARVQFQATDWLQVGGSVIFSNGTRFAPDQGAWFRAYFAVPIMPVYDEQNSEAEPIPLANAQDLGYRGGQNPLSSTMFNQFRIKDRNMNANFFVEVDLIPDRLKWRTSYAHNFQSLNRRNVNLPYFFGNNFQREVSSIFRENATISNQIVDNLLTYDNQFGDHNLQVMLGHSFRDESFQSLRARGEDFNIQDENTWYIDQALTIPEDAVGDGGNRQYGISYFTRLAYNYKHKYLLYGTFRADGSSKYQEKWGYFPTIGVGWVVSEEGFMDNANFMDYLKFRASWGELGNDKVAASSGANTTNVVETAIGDVLTSGTTTTSTFSVLEWERVEEFNVGLSALFLDERLGLELDYYVRNTNNAIIPVELPAVGGSIRRNVGIIRNSGLELALNWTNSTESGLRYSIGANFATLNNEAVDIFGQPHIDGGTAEFRQRTIEGQPLLAFFGREVIGVYQNQAEIEADPVAVENGLEPGDLIYKDQNGDGMIDDDDRVVLGSFLPNFTFGGNITASWKGLDFSVNVFGQTGNKILNRKRGEVIFTSDTNMDADLAKNRWHGEGTTNEYPSSKGIRKGWNQRLSTYFIEDGSFFRIQNVQIGYTVTDLRLFGAQMPQTRIYFTADKPYTRFSYNGFNPEVPNGVDRQTYPIPATYSVGLNIKLQ